MIGTMKVSSATALEIGCGRTLSSMTALIGLETPPTGW